MAPRTTLATVVAVMAVAAAAPQVAGAAVGALDIETVKAVPIAGTPYELGFGITRGRGFGGSRPQLGVWIQTAGADDDDAPPTTEQHVYTFTLPTTALKARLDKGVAFTLHGGRALGAWGSVDLSFAATKRTKTTTIRASNDCRAEGSVFRGTLRGSLVLHVEGLPTIRLHSIPVDATKFADVPGCMAQGTDTAASPAVPTACPTDSDTDTGGITFSTLYAGNVFGALDGAEGAQGLVALEISDADEHLTFNAAALVFADPSADTAPAHVFHLMSTSAEGSLIDVDPATQSATLAFHDDAIEGALAYTPDPATPPLVCGTQGYSAGTITGTATAHFGIGGDRTFTADATPAWLSAALPPVAAS